MVHASRWMSAVAILAAALTACSSNDDELVIPTSTQAPKTTSAAPTTKVKRAPIPVVGEENTEASAVGSIPLPQMLSLSVMQSPLGPILVTPTGRAVYYYLADDPKTGASSCLDQCEVHWPAVKANSEPPKGDGVEADLGIYDRANGTPQLTVNGRPVYFYRNDISPGSINGQGVAGMFWLVSPDGKIIKYR
jgi:predicted lipoprotein with Yx(FWY)xxD motif